MAGSETDKAADRGVNPFVAERWRAVLDAGAEAVPPTG